MDGLWNRVEHWVTYPTGWRLRNGDNSEKISSFQGIGVEVNWQIILNVKILHYQNVNTYDRH